MALFYGVAPKPTPEEGEVIVDLEHSLQPKIRGSREYIGNLKFDYATIVDGDGNSHQFTLDDIQANGFDVEQGHLRIDPDALLINGELDPEAVVTDINYDFITDNRFVVAEGEDVNYDIQFTEGEDVNTITGHIPRRGSYTYDFNRVENALVQRG